MEGYIGQKEWYIKKYQNMNKYNIFRELFLVQCKVGDLRGKSVRKGGWGGKQYYSQFFILKVIEI